MSRAFADITFTDGVKQAQLRYGSRASNEGFEHAEDPFNSLGENEQAFIEERDSFYLATVNTDGWPYVQHRGGPTGFLKVLDSRTIGFADYRGNRQYLSVGNLATNERVSLILMDYPNKTRLKVWGRARLIHQDDDAGLLAQLETATYKARIERGFVITVEALEWNCPQHITPRFTHEDVELMLQAERRVSEQEDYSIAGPALGKGPLALTIRCVEQLTPRIRKYRLEALDGSDLPPVTPGSHIRVPVLLEGLLDEGEEAERHYSICSDTGQRRFYDIAVLMENEGRGGSRSVHSHYRLERVLNCSLPENFFHLKQGEAPVLLIAGGIGITPILAMARFLIAQGRDFHLHYAARSRSEMAFAAEIELLLGERATLYFADEAQLLVLGQIMTAVPDRAGFYCCGPSGLLNAYLETASHLGLDASRVHYEQFTASSVKDEKGVMLYLARSGKTVRAASDKTLLQALHDEGIHVPFSCESGACKTCAITVLEGQPDHRDTILNPQEKAAGLMCPCVSRANTESLVLDL